MEPKGSSPYTQKLATCPYPEPDQSTLVHNGSIFYTEFTSNCIVVLERDPT
jgi:hypothetical protein